MIFPFSSKQAVMKLLRDDLRVVLPTERGTEYSSAASPFVFVQSCSQNRRGDVCTVTESFLRAHSTCQLRTDPAIMLASAKAAGQIALVVTGIAALRKAVQLVRAYRQLGCA